MKLIYKLFLFILVLAHSTQAQIIDSLEKSLQKCPQDSVCIKIYLVAPEKVGIS
ncbi:MAG: hypothetical protein ACK40K_00845 [Raineya sp.]